MLRANLKKKVTVTLLAFIMFIFVGDAIVSFNEIIALINKRK